MQHFLLAVDGVDRRFAVVDAQGGFQRGGVGGIQLERHIHHFLQFLDHAREHSDFIHARIADVDIQNLRARVHLRNGDIDDVIQIARQQRLLEALFARRVDSFANDAHAGNLQRHRRRAEEAAVMDVARAGCHAVDGIVQCADVVGVRAAAAANDAHARAHHIRHRAGEILRRQVIMPINRIGQTRVRFGNHGQNSRAAKLLKERQQLLRPLRAVQPDSIRAQAFQRPRHGRNRAAGEGAPGRVEAHRHPDGQRRMLLRGKQGGFRLVQVSHRLDADEVSARVHARVHNLREHVHRRLERQRAHRFKQFAQGANIQRDAGGCADASLFRR